MPGADVVSAIVWAMLAGYLLWLVLGAVVPPPRQAKLERWGNPRDERFQAWLRDHEVR